MNDFKFETLVASFHIGQIEIGENNEFGTGCIVRDRLVIGSNKTFGAQAAVVKNILDKSPDTYIGIPAKKLMKDV